MSVTFEQAWERAQVPGHLEIADGRLLWEAAAEAAVANPGLPFLEIGSYQGKSAILLAHHAPVVMVEPSWLWEHPENGGSYDGLATKKYKYTDRKVDERSRQALITNTTGLPHGCRLVPVPSFDFYPGEERYALVFIDGDHTNPAVSADCERALPNVRDGGFACFHDYTLPEYPDVVHAVDHFTAEWYVWGKAGSLLVKRNL